MTCRCNYLRAELSSEIGEGRGEILLLFSVGGGGGGAVRGGEELLGGAEGAETLAACSGIHIFLFLAYGKETRGGAGQWLG